MFRENVDNIWSEFSIIDIAKNDKIKWEEDTARKLILENEKCAYQSFDKIDSVADIIAARLKGESLYEE